MRYIALIVLVLTMAACGSSAPIAQPSSAVASSVAPGLTSAQGKRICQDIAAWIPQAEKQDMPRFSTQLI